MSTPSGMAGPSSAVAQTSVAPRFTLPAERQSAAGIPPRRRPLEVEDYLAIVAAGHLDWVSTELINGEIIEMSPQGSRHAQVLTRLVLLFCRATLPGLTPRVQMPLRSSEEASMPEPDICLVPSTPDDYGNGHPTTAALVIEVSDSTIGYYRATKSPIYAAMGIPEFWIVNLEAGCIEVQRDPIADFEEPGTGHRYATAFRIVPETSSPPLASLCAPDLAVDCAELLRT